MLFAVLFKDRPNQGALRATHLQSHIAWIATHPTQLRAAGSLRDALGQVPRGGLWIVEAENKDSVHALMQSDPFWTCGLRQSVEVLHWSLALDPPVGW